MKITIAGNVETACLNKLLNKGYKIKSRDTNEIETLDLVAEKDGNAFSATNFIELLGIVCLFEEDGERWGLNDRDDAWKEVKHL